MKAAKITIILLVLTALGIQPGAAQQYFNRRYTIGCGANVFTNALERNKKFYIISAAVDSSNYAGGGLFWNKAGFKFTVMDSVGNVLHTKLYQREDKIYTYICRSNNFVPYGDNFLLAFNTVDTTIDKYKADFYSTHLAVAEIDSMGNVLMYKEYDRPVWSVFDETQYVLMDCKQDYDGNWLLLSSVIFFGTTRFCLHKLDHNFDTIWVKTFKTGGFHHTPAQLLVEKDGYVMTGGVDNGNTKTFPDYYTSVLIKCDTGGNVLWDWTNKFDTAHLQYIINDIIRTKDGGYVYCGSGEGKPYFFGTGEWAGIEVKGWVEKLDASRNSVWKRIIDSIPSGIDRVQQTVLKELPNGDIMVAGGSIELIDKSDVSRGWGRGRLTRLNGSDGSIKWQRFYRVNENDTMRLNFYDMRQTSDGGYILAGEANNLIDRGTERPIQRGWLVKVDSNGCLGPDDPQCKPVSISPVVKSSDVFKVYPNPSAGSFTISSATQNGVSSSILNAIVYDVLGRPIHKESLHIQTGNATLRFTAPDGFYVLQLTDAEGKTHREKIEVRN